MTTTGTAETGPEALTARVAAHVGATLGGAGGQYIESCTQEAVALIDAYLDGAPAQPPQAVLARAIVEVAADLFHRRSARNGVAGFEDSEISPAPVRINRDPMTPAYPLLRRYTGPGIA